jgi:hypothetical protein
VESTGRLASSLSPYRPCADERCCQVNDELRRFVDEATRDDVIVPMTPNNGKVIKT